MPNGKRKGSAVIIAPPQTFNDLTLTLNGNTLTTTVSPDAVWAGIQKFVDPTTNDGASSVGNWNYWFGPSDGDESAEATGPGHYRGWCTDKNNNVHLSNWITI